MKKHTIGLLLIVGSLIITSCAHTFQKSPGKWTSQIKYATSENCPQFVRESTRKILSEVSPVDVLEVEKDWNFYVFCSPHIPPSWGYVVSDNFNGVAKPTAFAGVIIDCELWLNPRRYFYPTDDNKASVYATQTHEILHCLGLGHSDYSDSIMLPRSGIRARTMGQSDWNEINRIYGDF